MFCCNMISWLWIIMTIAINNAYIVSGESRRYPRRASRSCEARRVDNPCQNGGRCHVTLSADDAEEPALVTCHCPPAWTGAVCELERDPCTDGSAVCGPGWSCVRNSSNIAAGYDCGCGGRPGWQRFADGLPRCVDIDECALLAPACFNGGRCRNKAGSYECDCKPGFSGRRCGESDGADGWSTWGLWSPCSSRCGPGHRSRARSRLCAGCPHRRRQQQRQPCRGPCWDGRPRPYTEPTPTARPRRRHPAARVRRGASAARARRDLSVVRVKRDLDSQLEAEGEATDRVELTDADVWGGSDGEELDTSSDEEATDHVLGPAVADQQEPADDDEGSAEDQQRPAEDADQLGPEDRMELAKDDENQLGPAAVHQGDLEDPGQSPLYDVSDYPGSFRVDRSQPGPSSQSISQSGPAETLTVSVNESTPDDSDRAAAKAEETIMLNLNESLLGDSSGTGAEKMLTLSLNETTRTDDAGEKGVDKDELLVRGLEDDGRQVDNELSAFDHMADKMATFARDLASRAAATAGRLSHQHEMLLASIANSSTVQKAKHRVIAARSAAEAARRAAESETARVKELQRQSERVEAALRAAEAATEQWRRLEEAEAHAARRAGAQLLREQALSRDVALPSRAAAQERVEETRRLQTTIQRLETLLRRQRNVLARLQRRAAAAEQRAGWLNRRAAILAARRRRVPLKQANIRRSFTELNELRLAAARRRAHQALLRADANIAARQEILGRAAAAVTQAARQPWRPPTPRPPPSVLRLHLLVPIEQLQRERENMTTTPAIVL